MEKNDTTLHINIQNYVYTFTFRPNKKMCVSGSRSENFRQGRHTYFFWKDIILCILTGILPFKMHEIIFFPEDQKKIVVSPVNSGRFGLL